MATALTTVINQAPQGTTVISRSISNLDGSGNILIDSNTGNPYVQLVLNGLLSDADASSNSPVNQCKFTPEQSYDNGLTFTSLDPVYIWIGGTGPKGNFTRPFATFSILLNGQDQYPTNFRVTLDPITNNLNIGVQLGLQ